MNAEHIIGATTVTKVWLALGGPEPKRSRARAFYREGNNPQAVSLNDAKGCWFDHRDGVGGGVLDLIQRVLGCERAEALRWLSDFTGLPLEDRVATFAERRAFAERHEREEREIQDAESFRIAAMSLAEEILDQLPAAVPARYAPTQLFLRLRASQGPDLLALFREWYERDPRLTAGLVCAGTRAWGRQCDRLARFILAGAKVHDEA
jgi:hypothetical protein